MHICVSSLLNITFFKYELVVILSSLVFGNLKSPLHSLHSAPFSGIDKFLGTIFTKNSAEPFLKLKLHLLHNFKINLYISIAIDLRLNSQMSLRIFLHM